MFFMRRRPPDLPPEAPPLALGIAAGSGFAMNAGTALPLFIAFGFFVRILFLPTSAESEPAGTITGPAT